MNGKFKDLVAAGLVLALTGCGSMEPIVKSNISNAHKLAKDGSGVVVGLVYGDSPTEDVAKACNLVPNKDERCKDKTFKAIAVTPAFGFAAADARVLVLARSDVNFKICSTGGGKGCTYAKVKAEPGKFGTILEVYQEGENGCHWAGMPRMGGVVCNDWDYRKDIRDWDTTNGVMTVKDN